jgi:hypothetical protein
VTQRMETCQSSGNTLKAFDVLEDSNQNLNMFGCLAYELKLKI